MKARLKIVEILLEKSHSLKDIPMTDYTYLQPAQPSTLGYYLSSFLGPVLRNAERAQACFQRLNLSPAGVGSTNGSTLRLNREKLASRLGFADCVENSRDGVWQSDVAFEVAWLLASDSLVLARLSEDFLIWATKEFDYFDFADEVCRGSVAMPQKKNPYDLNFARGVASLLSGRVSGALSLGRTTTNQIDNRIFLYNELPESFDLVLETYHKLTKVLEGLKVKTQSLESRAQDPSLLAMDLVEELVVDKKISHAQAHSVKEVGGRDLSKTISKVFAERTGRPLNWSTEQWEKVLSSRKCVEQRKERGGASSQSLQKSLSNFRSLSQKLEELSQKLNEDWEIKKKKIVSEAQEVLS
jgi:argininosuccinate lyase